MKATRGEEERRRRECNKEHQGVGKGVGMVEKLTGERRAKVFFSNPVPPRACLEVIMRDTAEGC